MTLTRVRRLALASLRWMLIAAGFWVLYHYSVEAFGGRDKLWLFEKKEEHRYTAMAMLTGTLKLRAGLSKVGHDEQVYNGAGYTNWGFGVPLLQIPFHWFARHDASLPQKFFPDRAIYFTYFMAALPLYWAGFDRLFAMRQRPGASETKRHFVSWAATLFVLNIAFYPLMSCRFLIYEETICYFMIAQFAAIACYILAVRRSSAVAIAGLAIASGIGLLVRPTGPAYLGMWTGLVLLEHRNRRALLVFGATLVPFIVFWGVGNMVRTGSPVGTGFNNGLPFFDYHTPMLRFGSTCADTPRHALQAAARLFNAFFTLVTEDPKHWEWLDKCHFKFEERPPPAGGSYAHEPFFGMTVLVALVWMVLHQLLRRESRLAMYLPAGVVLLVFAAYVWAGGGFAWRYVGDFWPAIVLAAVQYVRFLPFPIVERLGVPLFFALVGGATAVYMRDIEPSVSTIDTLDETQASVMWDDFTNSRWAQDVKLPSHQDCGDRLDWPYHNQQGWRERCTVDTFTNLYLGVPRRPDDHYRLEFRTDGFAAATLRVYVNGRIYTAHRVGNGYLANVSIHFDSLATPAVMATIEWTREPEAPAGKLLSIRLS